MNMISVSDASTWYGMDVSRNGNTRRQLHNDKNPNMKLNDVYFSFFDCGERRAVIALTAWMYREKIEAEQAG